METFNQPLLFEFIEREPGGQNAERQWRRFDDAQALEFLQG
jgi:hypothetical protein